MQACRDFRRTLLTEQRGAVFALLAIVLIPLLLMIGLALDGGNLYRSKLALQNAADAAAYATVHKIVVEGFINFDTAVVANGCPPPGFKSGCPSAGCFATDQGHSCAVEYYLTPIVGEFVRSNLFASGFPHEAGTTPVSVNVDFTPGTLVNAANPGAESAFDLKVDVERRVDFFLMDALPGISDFSVVRTSASSRRRMAKVSLLLDLSDSMTCPVTGGCACKLPPGGVPCPAGTTKYEALIDAVAEFLKMFDLGHDIIDIVPYNTAALPQDIADLRTLAGLTGPTTTAADIDTMAALFKTRNYPTGASNMSDAMMRSWASMKNRLDTNALSDFGLAFVLFSDGAPTAARFLFSDPKTGGGGLPAFTADSDDINFGQSMGAYDYIHHMLTWDNGFGHFFVGPAMLHQTGYFGLSFNLLNHFTPELPSASRGEGVDAGASRAVCTGLPTEPPPVIADIGSTGSEMDAVDKVLKPCLESLNFHMPGDSTDIITGSFEDWRKLYYHAAIEMSDFIRENGGILYAVGLGDKWTGIPCVSAGVPAGCAGIMADDPYEGIDSVLFRKDVFMSRVALDPLVATQTLMPGTDDPVEFSYSEYQSYNDWDASAPEKMGEYYPTADASQIKLLFSSIARKVLLKLVS